MTGTRAILAKPMQGQTYWNGEPCVAHRVIVRVGPAPKSTWWCAALEGTERKAVEVLYHGERFLIDNDKREPSDTDDGCDAGMGWAKLTLGQGAPSWGHAALPEGTVILVDDPEEVLERQRERERLDELARNRMVNLEREKMARPGALLTEALVGATDPPAHGDRTDAHHECGCACEIVDPVNRFGTEFVCALCGEQLNVDSLGRPYRRWPGDLDDRVMQLRRVEREAVAANRAIIARLPRSEQVRLETMARKNPEKFKREVARVVERHKRSLTHSTSLPDLKPQARRRLAQLAELATQTVDQRLTMDAERRNVTEDGDTSPESA